MSRGSSSRRRTSSRTKAGARPSADCAHVLHVASPFPAKQPRDEQDLIRPAVEGTLRVLRAAAAAGVERLVQTSSMVAVMYGHPQERTAPFTEADWTPIEAPGVTAYAKSKTLAERAAREFMAKDKSGLHYASVNPGLVLGPALDRDIGTSAEIVQMMLGASTLACRAWPSRASTCATWRACTASRSRPMRRAAGVTWVAPSACG